MSKLEFNHYGKRAVRLLRVKKDGPLHEVAEWETDILLEGDLAASYLSDDNSSVVPTDTVKNTVLALAHDLEDATRDGFACSLAEHFISKYSHLTACEVEIYEKLWTRMAPFGRPHQHSFVRDSNGRPFSRVRAERDRCSKRSAGISGFGIMKTAESGFIGYSKCDLTTLPETTDRILATSLDALWDYMEGTTDLEAAVLDVMLQVFTDTYSPSVQRTLFLMGEAALDSFPGLSRIKLAMPNKHYLNINMASLGRPADQRKIFLPTDEPYGYIEAVVARE
jgi:urate oxidase